MTTPLAHAGGIPEMLSMIVPAGAFWLFYRLTRGRREQEAAKDDVPPGTSQEATTEAPAQARRAEGPGE